MVLKKCRWKRETLFEPQEINKERWILEREGKKYEFDVNVHFGKKCDIKTIKQNWPFKKEIELVRGKLKYFEKESKFITIKKCPV